MNRPTPRILPTPAPRHKATPGAAKIPEALASVRFKNIVGWIRPTTNFLPKTAKVKAGPIAQAAFVTPSRRVHLVSLKD